MEGECGKGDASDPGGAGGQWVEVPVAKLRGAGCGVRVFLIPRGVGLQVSSIGCGFRVSGVVIRSSFGEAEMLHPKPYPETRNPPPATREPKPLGCERLHPTPYTLHPKHATRSLRAET